MLNVLFLLVDTTLLEGLPLISPWDRIGLSAHRHFTALFSFCPFHMWDFLKYCFKTNAGALKEGSREKPIQG